MENFAPQTPSTTPAKRRSLLLGVDSYVSYLNSRHFSESNAVWPALRRCTEGARRVFAVSHSLMCGSLTLEGMSHCAGLGTWVPIAENKPGPESRVLGLGSKTRTKPPPSRDQDPDPLSGGPTAPSHIVSRLRITGSRFPSHIFSYVPGTWVLQRNLRGTESVRRLHLQEACCYTLIRQ